MDLHSTFATWNDPRGVGQLLGSWSPNEKEKMAVLRVCNIINLCATNHKVATSWRCVSEPSLAPVTWEEEQPKSQSCSSSDVSVSSLELTDTGLWLLTAPSEMSAAQSWQNIILKTDSNPLNAESNPICHLPALVGAQHIVHVSRVRVNVTSGLDGPMIESRWVRYIPHLPITANLRPTSLLLNGYWVCFPGVKRLGRGVDHPLTSSAKVKERVQAYFYSPSVPPWRLTGWNLTSEKRIIKKAFSWSINPPPLIKPNDHHDLSKNLTALQST